MKRKSLDLSTAIDATTLSVLELLDDVAAQLGTDYVLVGATARDLVLHHVYNADIKRATTDVDFAIQVDSWNTFSRLKDELVTRGYRLTNKQHRLQGPGHAHIDIIPFGALSDKGQQIEWPPEYSVEMSILGFKEAHAHAVDVVIKPGAAINIPVATPQGLTLLKLIAWSERSPGERKKDASDLLYIFENYERVADVTRRLYEDAHPMETYDWQLELASVHLLGMDVASIAEPLTRSAIEKILAENIQGDSLNQLAQDMGRADQYEGRLRMLRAFNAGFNEG